MTDRQQKWLTRLRAWAMYTNAQVEAIDLWLPGPKQIDALSPSPRRTDEDWGDFTLRANKEAFFRGRKLIAAVWSFAWAGDERAQRATELLKADVEAADFDGLDPAWCERAEEDAWDEVVVRPFRASLLHPDETELYRDRQERRLDEQAEAEERSKWT